MSRFMCVTVRGLRVRVVRVCMRTSLLCGCPLSVYRKINRGYFGAGAWGWPRRRGRGYPPQPPARVCDSHAVLRYLPFARLVARFTSFASRYTSARAKALVCPLSRFCAVIAVRCRRRFSFFDWGIFFATERGGGKPRRVVVLFYTGVRYSIPRAGVCAQAST